MSISASQTVDKTENAKNNEIKILVLTPESLKSHKFFFLRQPRSQIIAKMRNPCRFSLFLPAHKCLNFMRKVEQRENSNVVKEPGYEDFKKQRIYGNPVKT